MRMNKKMIAIWLTLCVIFSLVGCAAPVENSQRETTSAVQQTLNPENIVEITEEDSGHRPQQTQIEKNTLTITMLDVGQGLCVLFESDDQYLLFDGADRDYASYVVSYLQQHGIGLDYVIASHPHDDHINGIVGVLKTIPVKHIIDSGVVAATRVGHSYETEKANCINKGTEYDVARPGDVFQLGSSQFTILSPAHEYDDVNNMSVAIKIESGDFSCVITGDAEKDAEQDMLVSGIDLDADLYIAGHHGSSTSSTESILEAMSPSVVWISCGMNNEYGHPHEEALNRMKRADCEIFSTAKSGELKCVVDGDQVNVSTEKTVEQINIEKNTEATIATDDYFVLNTNTKKIHLPSCEHVNDISQNNKQEYSGNVQSLIEDGYSTCKKCHPN